MTANDTELASLLAACRLLIRSILTRARTDDDPRGSTVRLRTAKKHVHKAVLSLSLDGTTTQGLEMGPAGNLERITTSLTAHLVQDLMAEVDREQAPELEGRVARVRDQIGRAHV